jgi:hypothetical protein
MSAKSRVSVSSSSTSPIKSAAPILTPQAQQLLSILSEAELKIKVLALLERSKDSEWSKEPSVVVINSRLERDSKLIR